MGNPDMPTPDFIVDKLCETAHDPRALTAIALRAASRGCARPMSPITSAASAWSLIPTAK